MQSIGRQRVTQDLVTTRTTRGHWIYFKVYVAAQSLQSCPTLCDPGVHRILQVKILEWVAISSSRESSQPRDGSHVVCVSCITRMIFLPLNYLVSSYLKFVFEFILYIDVPIHKQKIIKHEEIIPTFSEFTHI